MNAAPVPVDHPPGVIAATEAAEGSGCVDAEKTGEAPELTLDVEGVTDQVLHGAAEVGAAKAIDAAVCIADVKVD